MTSQATMRDVAGKAGVHPSTVSLALRDDPRISPQVRERVKGVAEELGYRPNPMVAALMSVRRAKKEVFRGALGYLTNHPTRHGWRPPYHDRPDYFPGAKQRAQELGFNLEHFWLREPGMTSERLAQIFIHRGIKGLLIGRLPDGIDSLDFPWQHFSCVALGLTLKTPALNHVAEDAFSSASLAMNECIAKGYRRVGFVFSEPDDSPGTGDRFLGAYLRHQMKFEPKDRIPQCDFLPGTGFGSHFKRWVERYKPDAVLATHAEPIVVACRTIGWKLPKQIKLVALVNDKVQHGFAGIYHDAGILGRIAVDMVVGMLHRNDIGVPSEPRRVLLSGVWVNGGPTLLRSEEECFVHLAENAQEPAVIQRCEQRQG